VILSVTWWLLGKGGGRISANFSPENSIGLGAAVSKPACHRDPSVVRNTPYYSISSLLCVARRVSCVGSLVGPVRVRQQWHHGGAGSPSVWVGGGNEGGVVITVNR
jgi:hypothetical protein